MLRDVNLLVEAFSYAARFRGKRVVVKLGGAVLEDDSAMREMAQDVIWLQQGGIRPVIVHGGGPQIDASLKEKGIPIRRVNGIRITDAETLEVVRQSLAELNGRIVSWMRSLGGEAVGWCGTELVVAAPLSPEYLQTGDVEEVEEEKLHALPSSVIPVLSCLARGRDEKVYNVNADYVAIALAGILKAEKLILMTDVPGVLLDPADPSTLISTLTASQARDLIQKGAVSGGMVAKLNACLSALTKGVHKAHIIQASQPHALLAEIYTQEGAGTQFIPDASPGGSDKISDVDEEA